MHKFVRNLITEWRRLGLPFSDEAAVIAVSGGADSVSLLLALAELKERRKLNLRFVVSHFDHGLRGKESDGDAKFVEELARQVEFEFVSGKGKIARAGNLEQNARNARYGFLLKTARNYSAFAVLTAHTVNDQAETFLMNLIRGSGAEGLSAMPPVREFKSSDILLARPMLRWAMREETEDFCREHDIAYRNDAMNEDPAFTRVRIRKELIPMLREYNPKIVASLAKTAELISITGGPEAFFESGDGSLAIKELQELSKSDLYRTLRLWIKNKRGSLRGISVKHIEAIEQLIYSRKSGKTAELPGNTAVIKGSGRLCIADIMVEK